MNYKETMLSSNGNYITVMIADDGSYYDFFLNSLEKSVKRRYHEIIIVVLFLLTVLACTVYSKTP